MLISAGTHMTPKQFVGCSESATKVTENILSILNVFLILCCHSCPFSKAWERTPRAVLLRLLQSPLHLTWANWDSGTQRSKRKESSFFISFHIRVVLVLPWALPLRSGCVGILRNNKLRFFASFSNQLQLNAKTSTVSVYLSNMHPPNNSARCCYAYFTGKQMVGGGKWHWSITALCSCTRWIIGCAFLFIPHIYTYRQNWAFHSINHT